jgi:hypothetical protein
MGWMPLAAAQSCTCKSRACRRCRILAGIGAGGVFPIALGLTGNLLAASLSGLIGDFLGWRSVLAVLGSKRERV